MGITKYKAISFTFEANCVLYPYLQCKILATHFKTEKSKTGELEVCSNGSTSLYVLCLCMFGLLDELIKIKYVCATARLLE